MFRKAPQTRRTFIVTSIPTLAAMPLMGSHLAFAQRPESTTVDIIVRKNLPAGEVSDLNRFYAERLNPLTGANRSDTIFMHSGIENFSFRVDPGTIKTILEIGVFLYGLFSGGNERPAEWIERISAQLSKISKILEEVQNILEELKILIKHEFIQNAEFEVLALADVYVRNATKYATSPSSAANRQQMAQLLYDIQGRVAKCRLYGYATYNTLGYALRVETDLLYLLRESRQIKRTSFDYYHQFFSDCLDPQLTGSVTNIRTAAESSVRSLESKYPPRNNVRENLGEVLWYSAHCDNSADVYRVTTGSLSSTFSGYVRTENEKHHCECQHCRVENETASLISSVKANDRGDALRPHVDALNGLLNTWNQAGTQFRDLLPRIESLKVAEQQVVKLQTIARELRDNAT